MPKKDIKIHVAWLKFFITTSVFELILSSVLNFFQCDFSCCLYILHINWCILMSYICLFELILSFPHKNLSYPMHKNTYINICVPLLVFFITTSVFELTLSSVLSFFQCDLSCCLYILHIPWCILISYTCLSELHFELHFELPPLEFELSHAKKINIRVAWLKLFITTSIFELILSSVLSFLQCDLSCYLYIL